jgi:hypothetical protein
MLHVSAPVDPAERLDAAGKKGAAGTAAQKLFLVVLIRFVFFFFVIVVEEVAVFGGFFFLFFVIIVEVVGNKIEMDGMGLRDFEFGLAFGTAQDFAFFDFVFVNVDFGGTFRAADHGSILRSELAWRRRTDPRCRQHGVLYTALSEVNCTWTAAAPIVNRFPADC